MAEERNDIKEIDLIVLVSKIWNRRRMVFKWVGLGVLCGVIIAFSIPKKYEAAIILAPEKTGKNPMTASMGALAGMMGVDVSGDTDGVTDKLYPKIFKSRPFLMEFANIEVQEDEQKMPLYDYLLSHQRRPWWTYITGAPGALLGWVRSLWSDSGNKSIPFSSNLELQSSFVNSLAMQISIAGQSDDETLVISSKMQSPTIALLIVDSLYTKLQEYMTTYRTHKTRLNLESNLKMLEEARLEYYKRDSIYAVAKDRNQSLVVQTARLKLDRLENEKSLAFTLYQQLASQVEVDRVKLQEKTPIATIIQPAVMPLYPSSPNKKVIVILFGMLAGFLAVGSLVVKELR